MCIDVVIIRCAAFGYGYRITLCIPSILGNYPVVGIGLIDNLIAAIVEIDGSTGRGFTLSSSNVIKVASVAPAASFTSMRRLFSL
jgi:hypothetical protein